MAALAVSAIATASAQGVSVTTASQVDEDRRIQGAASIDIVYPRGTTLTIEKPAVQLLTSGYVCYPVNCPIAAATEIKNGGKLVVIGSAEMFTDDWLHKEANTSIMETILQWLFFVPIKGLNNNNEKINKSLSNIINKAGIQDDETNVTKLLNTIIPVGQTYDVTSNNKNGTNNNNNRKDINNTTNNTNNDTETVEKKFIPDTAALAEKLRSCLQETEPLPRDFTQLFDDKLFKFDITLIPETINLYNTLGIKHDTLTLIPPQFEAPLPLLQPAVFPPTMREPPPPALELFDLDEHFASERARLAQLTNKCNDEDLDYYIRECGNILGVSNRLQSTNTSSSSNTNKPSSYTNNNNNKNNNNSSNPTAMEILEHVFRNIVNYKKLNQEPEMDIITSTLTNPNNNNATTTSTNTTNSTNLSISTSNNINTNTTNDDNNNNNNHHFVPGAMPLRHTVGAAGLGAGIAAGYTNK